MVQELSRSPERIIQVDWDAEKGQAFVVKLDILLEDRKNMLRDITQAISDTDANVRGAEISGKGGPVVGSFVVEIKNISHLNRVIAKVKKIKGVISIERAKGVDIDSMAAGDGAVS
jgi:guanosine-3',5'-bis(diphosphate) 3'-pyrophosphohydrolase